MNKDERPLCLRLWIMAGRVELMRLKESGDKTVGAVAIHEDPA